MAYRRNIDVNPFNSITSILIGVLIFVALYWIASSIFKILSVAAPFLLVAALIINHNVVLNYGKWLFSLLKKNPLMGIGAVLLSIFGFPIISGFLLVKALLYRRVNKMKKEYENKTYGEYTEYEEIKDEPEIRLELPNFEQPKKNKRDDYDQFFE